MMAEGVSADAWSRESIMLSMFYSANKRDDDKPMTADDFNPYAKPKAPEKLSREESRLLLRSVLRPKKPIRKQGKSHG